MVSPKKAKPHILLVDDEPLVLSSYGRALRGIDAEILLAEGPEEGFKVLEGGQVDVVIADYRMPGMNGDEFLEKIREQWPEVVRMLNTAYADVQIVEEVVRRAGIFRFLTKPCEPEKLKAAVLEALAYRLQRIESEIQSEKLKLDLLSFRQIFHSAIDPMMVADLSGRLVEVNTAFVRSEGGDLEQALKKRPTILSGWEQNANWPQILEIVHREGHWSDEVHRPTEDRFAILTLSMLKDTEGHPYALAATEKDVTLRHQLERESWAAQYEVILALAKLAEYRDPETGAHLERMQRYSQMLALHLAAIPRFVGTMNKQFADAIFAASPLHDIGKVGIPDAVLLKPGKLTAEEWRVMQLHSTIGAEVLSAAGKTLKQKNWLTLARTIALEHHEKWDGSGYPNKLKGEAIDVSARIVALADAYDAITSKRVYKPAMSHDEARSRILESSGTHFDPAVVEAFLSAEQEFLDVKRRYSNVADEEKLLNAAESRTQSSTWHRIEQLIDSSTNRNK